MPYVDQQHYQNAASLTVCGGKGMESTDSLWCFGRNDESVEATDYGGLNPGCDSLARYSRRQKVYYWLNWEVIA